MTDAAIESGVAALVEACEIVAEFQGIVRRKALADLHDWIDRANRSRVAAFARGLTKDKDAVEAAMSCETKDNRQNVIGWDERDP